MSQERSKEYTYILKCKKKKYFVGKRKFNDSKDQSMNIRDYPSKCAWTNLYTPLSVQEILLDRSIDDSVLDCMKKYGIENVRGGSWQQAELTNAQLESLKKLTSSAPAPTVAKENKEIETKKGNKEDWPCDICGQKFDSFAEAEEHERTCEVASNCIQKMNQDEDDSFGISDYVSAFINHSMGMTGYLASIIRE